MSRSKVTEKYLTRLDELISTGNEICSQNESKEGFSKGFNGGRSQDVPDEIHTVHPDFFKWTFSVVTFLNEVIPKEHPHNKYIQSVEKSRTNVRFIGLIIQLLQSIREDLSKGFLNNVVRQIEMEISSDYMEQAENLVEKTQGGSLNHIPAAVLAGAVLEKRLKKLCSEQVPEIPVLTDGGKPKTMNPLIDDLKKAGLFPETKAKELKLWADIRNNAAHGNFASFTKDDVERMITGIKTFLSEFS